jgi:RimJ/RimL family protein N-acetyltransferase
MRVEPPFRSARLLLRRPALADAEAVYARYAADPEVTRYLTWPRHRSIDDSRVFIGYSDSEWSRWPVGPLLIEDPSTGQLLGSTGLTFESADVAATGYALARDAWGQGSATEALALVVELAGRLALRRLFALCHVNNHASVRVLERSGFALDSRIEGALRFPNLESGGPQLALRYLWRGT